MDSIRMVRIEDRLRLMIKLIFLFLLKFVLLLIWGASIWGIYTLLYDRYVLEAYPLRDYLPVLIFCFGNIWVLPWLILWYEKLYPVFDKPKMYQRVKVWFISLKEQSTVGMCIYSCIDFLIKLCLITYGTMVVLAGFILAGAILVLPLLMILGLIFRQLLKAFENTYFISDTLLTYLHNAKAKLFIFRNSLAFISLFVYLPYKKQIALRCLV